MILSLRPLERLPVFARTTLLREIAPSQDRAHPRSAA
jgi:hypothetical protein